jgi:hypothetical protein
VKITRRQLRRLIRESLDLVTEAYIEYERMTDDPAQLANMKKIDWSKCGLPDAAAWQTYTANSVKQSMKKSDINAANQQFAGAMLVPPLWESVAQIGQDTVEQISGILEISGDWWPYESGYSSYVDYWKAQSKSKGRDIHAPEFMKIFVDEFMNAYQGALKTSKNKGKQAEYDNPTAIKGTRTTLMSTFATKFQNYLKCDEDLKSFAAQQGVN